MKSCSFVLCDRKANFRFNRNRKQADKRGVNFENLDWKIYTSIFAMFYLKNCAMIDYKFKNIRFIDVST